EFISKYTGDAVNCIPVIAKLLGNETVSKQSGDMFIELGFAPNFAEATPLRIKKKQLLQGGALEVNIGGHVPAGFDSGAVSISFISDAVGYLLENPYTSHASAARLLILNMDVAMVTADPRAGGAFTQDLLHVSLVGTAKANKSGQLVADAIGIVEPSVLGAENGYGMLNFHMEAYADAENLPSQAIDTTAPKLMSWVPGVVGQAVPQYAGDEPTVELGDNNNVATLIQPQDPIILNFSEPLDINSINEESLKLTLNGDAEPFTWYLDGAALVLKPTNELKYSQPSKPMVFQVKYSNTITDLSGNAVDGDTLTFKMPLFVSTTGHSPVILSAYPGFPCATTGVSVGTNNGRCDGGKSSDDIIPIQPMPADRAIMLTFSQIMDKASVQMDKSFVVQKCLNSNCSQAQNVEGEVTVAGKYIQFMPLGAWEENTLYRYTLKSADYTKNNQVCKNGAAVCGWGITNSHPVLTALLKEPGYDQGGPALTMYFKGAPAAEHVQQSLRNLPTSDVDGSFEHGVGEVTPSQDINMLKNTTKLVGTKTSGLIGSVAVGCKTPSSCPDDSYIYMSGALNVDILGYDEAEGAVKVDIHPTQLVTSSATVYSKVSVDLWLFEMKIEDLVIPTGKQIMRIRNAKENGKPVPVRGWIRDVNGQAKFQTTLDVYLDAPYLKPSALYGALKLKHNLHSYPLKVQLEGDVTFLPDGRLQIEQLSQKALSLEVEAILIKIVVGNILIERDAGTMTLEIPKEGVNLNYITAPVKL
ncbi:MAG: Ig-like domain-containing protein, partial [Venatoribacter sp.]